MQRGCVLTSSVFLWEGPLGVRISPESQKAEVCSILLLHADQNCWQSIPHGGKPSSPGQVGGNARPQKVDRDRYGGLPTYTQIDVQQQQQHDQSPGRAGRIKEPQCVCCGCRIC
jgi:hypothetical protein